MADRDYRRDRYGRDRQERDRGFNRQAEQFDATDYGWRDNERGSGQMGDDFGQFETAGQSYSRDYAGDRFRTGRSYGARGYRESFGDNPSRENRDYRGTWGQGVGSQLAANHGEWRDEFDGSPRRDYASRGPLTGEGGWLDRAGETVASWFRDDDDDRRYSRGYRGHGPAGYTRSDERILEDACDELTDDWGVDARQIQVSVTGGDVTLEGTVPSREQKRRAEECVEDISGVKNVQNNLRVQQSETWNAGDRGTTGAI